MILTGGARTECHTKRFATFTYLHDAAQNPICGAALNVASPEMLYVSGSSGGQFDERAQTLRGTGHLVSAIEAAATSRPE